MYCFVEKIKKNVQKHVSECRNFRRKKISQAAYIGFHPILSQDPKDLDGGRSVEG